MRVFCAPLFASVFAASTSFAWMGGPFSNDSPLQSGINGTYQASVTGKNLGGVVNWRYEAGTGAGIYVIYHKGRTYSGSTVVAMDNPNATIAGALSPNLGGTTTQSGSFGGNDFNFTSTTSIVPFSSATFSADLNDSLSSLQRGLSGAFLARVTSQYPAYQFQGEGELSSPANEEIVEVTVDNSTNNSNNVVNAGLTNQLISFLNELQTNNQIVLSNNNIGSASGSPGPVIFQAGADAVITNVPVTNSFVGTNPIVTFALQTNAPAIVTGNSAGSSLNTLVTNANIVSNLSSNTFATTYDATINNTNQSQSVSETTRTLVETSFTTFKIRGSRTDVSAVSGASTTSTSTGN